jgi:F-box and WD-40 domain protein CDC4
MAPIHRLAAHDNSVTSLQFDDTRVVSGGSDGRVKVWDLKTGQLVRELTDLADAVWRVAFEEEKCVVMASRSNRTIMEVWSFSPPEDVLFDRQPTLAQRMLNTPHRPLSAIEYRNNSPDQPMTGLLSSEATYAQDDIDMADAGPSTAPPRATGSTFFHDD